MIRVPIMHPWDFVAGRVGHEVEQEGAFIHEARISIEDRHLVGFVELTCWIALENQITKNFLVATVVPEVERAVFNREVIPVFEQIENKWGVFEQDDA